MTTTIAIANQKGGVGKTTVSHNLAHALKARNCSVLLVDLDPQAALTEACGFDPAALRAPGIKDTVYDVLISPTLYISDIARSLSPNLWLAPANIDLAGAEVELYTELGWERKLKEALPSRFGYTIIDCPPSLGILTTNALVAADKVLIPVQASYLAYRGMEALLERIAKVRHQANFHLEIIGVLLTMFNGSAGHDKDMLNALRATYGQHCFDVVIPQRTALKDAIYEHKSIFEYDPKNAAAEAFTQLAEVIDG